MGGSGDMNSTHDSHEPVLVEEIMFWLQCKPGGVYVDCTLGYAGLASHILNHNAPNGILVGIDRDAAAVEAARMRLSGDSSRVRLRHGNFRELKAHIVESGIRQADGVIFDLGVSSPQLDRAERGFSFREDGPLDMRMDQSEGCTAADLVRDLPETELADMIYHLGEERYSRRIARAIVQARMQGAIETTGKLAAAVFWQPILVVRGPVRWNAAFRHISSPYRSSRTISGKTPSAFCCQRTTYSTTEYPANGSSDPLPPTG